MSVTLLDKSCFDLADLIFSDSSDSETFDSGKKKPRVCRKRTPQKQINTKTSVGKCSKRKRTQESPEPAEKNKSGGKITEKNQSTVLRTPERPESPYELGFRGWKTPENTSTAYPYSNSNSPLPSPEIEYNSPVRYIIVQEGTITKFIKQPMSGRPRRTPQKRPQKCSANEIENLLQDDDDDGEVQESSSSRSSSQSPNDKKRNADGVRRGIKLKIRRSTEQSSLKVETLSPEPRKRPASLRSNVIPPVRYRSDNEDSTPRKQPSKSARSVSRTQSSDDDSQELLTKRITRSCRKLNVSPKTPVKTSTKSPESATKSRKRTTKSSISADSEMNKENETEDSDADSSYNIFDRPSKKSDMELKTMTPSRRDNVLENAEKGLVTPGKKISFSKEIRTPRTPQTPRMARIEEEEFTTPKRSQRRLVNIPEEPVTPKHRTPSARAHTPSVKIGSLTPSMRQRAGTIHKPKSLLEDARAQLHVSAVPKSLPCREKEFNDIFTFLERKLVDQSGGCIYVSGVPGTGKTATVNEVIRCLRRLVTKGSLEPFDYVEINGMKLSEPRQSYVQILKQLTGQAGTWEESRWALEERFAGTKKKGKNTKAMTLLLIDELDVLCNKRQDVVYNLLDWPSKPGAKLVVITIANTMDLPERVLMSRVTSRLGLTRLTFQPYNHKQLQEIVIARLNESEAFQSDAVQLVARKVAAVSGDARRALDICRRATEIAEVRSSLNVTILHVNEALTEMIANPKVQAIKYCSEMEKVFLQAVCAETERTGVEETNFNSVYKQFEALCSFDGVKTPNITESLRVCVKLSDIRLLLCDNSRSDITQKIILNVSSDDIHFALKASGL